MKELTLIVAKAENGVIGVRGKIPWYIPEDLKHFKDLTMGSAVIMGRKTYESIPDKFRPLKGRDNIVLTRGSYVSEGIYLCHSINEAVEIGKSLKDNVFVAGGQEIYEQTIAIADRLRVTEIHQNFQGDASFPRIDLTKWKEVSRDDYLSRIIPFSFVEYVRK